MSKECKTPIEVYDNGAPVKGAMQHKTGGDVDFLFFKDTQARSIGQNIKTKIRRKSFKFTTFVRFKTIGYWFVVFSR